MRVYLICLLSSAGLLWSCTTSKLKTKYTDNELFSMASDSSYSETSWRSLMATDSLAYDELWWLRGNARWHPDSGVAADELLIRYRSKAWHSAKLLDSQQHVYERKHSLQQETNTKLEEKQKLQKNLPILWWAFLLLLLSAFYAIRRRLDKNNWH